MEVEAPVFSCPGAAPTASFRAGAYPQSTATRCDGDRGGPERCLAVKSHHFAEKCHVEGNHPPFLDKTHIHPPTSAG